MKDLIIEDKQAHIHIAPDGTEFTHNHSSEDKHNHSHQKYESSIK